jgi:PAS domain S-box-containing protein
MERLQSVFDGVFDGVWFVAADGRTTYTNGAMARLLGSSQAAMRGRPIADFLDESRKPGFETFLRRQRVHAGGRVEFQFRREDGAGSLIALVAGRPITAQDGTYVGTILDISDMAGKTAVDAQVIQNQRLEAIGQFAGGIAHDFNNLLTSIRGYAELARASLPEGDSVREDLDQVLAGADRASAITHKLLAFTRRQILVPVVVDPAEIAAELIPILGPLLGENVDVSLEVAPGHGHVLVDPTQLEQVIMNLAINARDAMPWGGRVTISIRDVVCGDVDLTDLRLNPGPFVRISLADTGTGMDEATLARIFDPFFTTKGPGKGTGLGLSAVSGIVTQSGGLVHVESVLGRGSVFHVDLPRLPAALLHGHPRNAEAIAPKSGLVLVVEDDAAVLGFASRSLETAGYTVLRAARAGSALRAVERWGDKIDALVTDIAMPGMNGLDLAARIVERRPGIGVVFISGNADVVLERARELREAGEFVGKPFTSGALSGAVGRAVEGGRVRFCGQASRTRARAESGTGTRRTAGAPILSLLRRAAPESNSE